MEKILQKENIKVFCEHCKKTVNDVWVCKMDSVIGIRYALLCTRCQRLIGIYSSAVLKGDDEEPDVVVDELQIPLN